MDSLNQLILKYGIPDALIDHWSDKAKKMAIWGFDEVFVCDSNGCKLNNEKLNGDPMHLCNQVLKSWDSDSNHPTAIGYISYDMKNVLFPHLEFKNNNNQILMWFGKPSAVKEYLITNDEEKTISTEYRIDIDTQIPNSKYYQKKIQEIKNYLKIGETYQINYSNPIQYKYKKSKFDLYMYLRDIAKPPNGIYLNTGMNEILSLSPEKFFEINNHIIHTYPIKGTINRSPILTKDIQLKTQLMNSEKDKAEHLMIVDLLRNDLGKICEYGSIKVKDLYKVKSFETIHHMETDVYGTLFENIEFKDIIKALFPSGSITGAPKERSMEIIDRVENYNRGIYTGSIGYLSKNGYMNFNVAIRTMYFNDNNGIYPVGGGIVWDSTAESERIEALNKAKIISKLFNKEISHHA
tara:strand:+ start:663 stop:1886 length:1224 start_codon:yes stop_codon:yes gene_type:complete